MILEQLSNLSQAVAAVAVIVSLVFVGIQLRQSTEQGRQANRLARAQVTAEIRNSFNDLLRRAFLDADLSDAVFALADHAKQVEERHIAPLSGLCFNFMGVARQAYELQQGDLIDAWALRDVEQQLFHIISHPRFHALYRAMVGAVDPASVTEADRAWVRHINAGLKQYKSNTNGNPYFLAISGPPESRAS
jgi:hypothetical protein